MGVIEKKVRTKREEDRNIKNSIKKKYIVKKQKSEEKQKKTVEI